MTRTGVSRRESHSRHLKERITSSECTQTSMFVIIGVRLGFTALGALLKALGKAPLLRYDLISCACTNGSTPRCNCFFSLQAIANAPINGCDCANTVCEKSSTWVIQFNVSETPETKYGSNF